MTDSRGPDLTFPKNQEWLLFDYELYLGEDGQPPITETLEQKEMRERRGVAQLYYVGHKMSDIIKCFPEAEAILKWIKDNNIDVWNVIDKRRNDVEGEKPSVYPLFVYQELWNNNIGWDYSDLQYHLNLSKPGVAVLLVETLRSLGYEMRKARSPSPSETSSDEDSNDPVQLLVKLFDSDPKAFEESLWTLAQSSREVYAQRLVELSNIAPSAFCHHLAVITTAYQHEVSSLVSRETELRLSGEEDLARVLMPPPPLPRTKAVFCVLEAQANKPLLRRLQTINPNIRIPRTQYEIDMRLTHRVASLKMANFMWDRIKAMESSQRPNAQ
jgi:hypothetical protein